MANARIDNTKGAAFEEFFSEGLGSLIADRIERRGEFRTNSQIVKLTCKICQIFVVGHLILELANFRERDRLMVGYLCLSRLDGSCGVPGTA